VTDELIAGVFGLLQFSPVTGGFMRLVVVGLGVMVVAAMAGRSLPAVSAQDAAATPAFYTEKVKPILVTNCYQCHGGTSHKGGLSLATRSGMLKGGRDGSVLTPGDPANSMMVKLIRHEGPADDPMPMPPAPRSKISDADIATITAWVKAGAVMPDVPTP
jgi:cytochrome c